MIPYENPEIYRRQVYPTARIEGDELLVLGVRDATGIPTEGGKFTTGLENFLTYELGCLGNCEESEIHLL